MEVQQQNTSWNKTRSLTICRPLSEKQVEYISRQTATVLVKNSMNYTKIQKCRTDWHTGSRKCHSRTLVRLLLLLLRYV
jgi:hypothetical protein